VNYGVQPATLQASRPSGNRSRMSNALRAFRYFLVVAVGIGSAQLTCAQEESKKHHEIRYKMTISTTPPARKRCEARLEIFYLQKNTVATVDATLDNNDCGASSGEYTVLVRIRDENSELQLLEYPETWRRDDDQAIELTKDYFIGDNVDLVSVRPRKVQCICDSSEEEAAAPEEQAKN